MTIEVAIKNAIRYRHHNALITETFEVARKQAEQCRSKGLESFPIVVKDCFA